MLKFFSCGLALWPLKCDFEQPLATSQMDSLLLISGHEHEVKSTMNIPTPQRCLIGKPAKERPTKNNILVLSLLLLKLIFKIIKGGN